MTQIRVLQIVPTLGFGGVAQFLLNYYKMMDKNQIIFDFITHGGEESFHEELKNEGSKIFYINSIGKVGIKGYLSQLKYIFENNNYDIVHTHDGHLTGLTAMMCKQYFKGPVFCHAHTTRCVNNKHRIFMPVFRLLSRHFGDKLLGCGVKACEYCYGKDSKYTVIHNAISLDRFWNVQKEDVEALRMSLSISKDAYIIGHIGVFSPQKNHLFILKIFNYLLKKHPEAVLVLVGEGDLKTIVENEAERRGIYNNIRFVGIQKDIPLYMHLFDTFILPSLYEGLPVCGVEAQSVVRNVCFANTIDFDVDAGIGSVKFISIDDNSLPEWEKSIFENKKRPSKEKIKQCFIQNGYEINESVKILFNIYKESARKK